MSGIGPPPPPKNETSPPRTGAERSPSSHSAGTMVLPLGVLRMSNADCCVVCCSAKLT
ncbi:MAG: hypothetical protein KIS78_04880 [Labilithrix sp.]|nr:hypothetical protein [Labilithrix sp.]